SRTLHVRVTWTLREGVRTMSDATVLNPKVYGVCRETKWNNPEWWYKTLKDLDPLPEGCPKSTRYLVGLVRAGKLAVEETTLGLARFTTPDKDFAGEVYERLFHENATTKTPPEVYAEAYKAYEDGYGCGGGDGSPEVEYWLSWYTKYDFDD